jgi:hypothetical protein
MEARPNTDRYVPTYIVERSAKDEPRTTISSADIEDPSREIPYTERFEPKRMKDRIESDEPRCRKSRTENAEPSLVKPYTDIKEPKRMKLLRLIELPSVT